MRAFTRAAGPGGRGGTTLGVIGASSMVLGIVADMQQQYREEQEYLGCANAGGDGCVSPEVRLHMEELDRLGQIY